MALRSRTSLFLQYRNSFARSSAGMPLVSTPGYNAERAGLIESSDHVIELSVLPPRWVDIVEEVDEEIEAIKERIAKLQTLHKKHTLPGFDDRTGEEEEIEHLTGEITKLFHECQRKIRQIADESRSSTAQSQEAVMSKNIQTSLATKLQEISSSFRKQQSSYMKELKGREARSPAFFSTSSRDSSEEDLELVFTAAQLAVTESSDTMISQREREINEIAKSIYDLAEIFKDLQTLVIDQGTLLDRIDYNVEQMNVNVISAARELDEGEKYQKKSRN
ncbi:8787_t:CDS:2, partial [Paraglomus occultum]